MAKESIQNVATNLPVEFQSFMRKIQRKCFFVNKTFSGISKFKEVKNLIVSY